MKITSSLYYIICSELINSGYNEFITQNRNQLTYYDKNARVISQINMYEKNEIIKACQNTIFYGLSFLNNRKRFEKEFINHFLTRNIKYQTYEVARLQLVSFVFENLELIESIYNAENLLLGKSQTTSTGKTTSETTNKNNSLYADLPQDNINMNVNNDTLDYASNNSINKSKSNGTSDSNNVSNSQSYNIDNLTKLYMFKAQLFNDLDKRLFSQLF